MSIISKPVLQYVTSIKKKKIAGHTWIAAALGAYCYPVEFLALLNNCRCICCGSLPFLGIV
jgi:hypothetical protein